MTNFSVDLRAEQFELLVERATDFALFLLDAEGNIATWNEGARRILGYDESEVLGRTTEHFYTPEDQAAGVPARQLRIAREQGRAINERWQMKKDGSRYYASGIDQAIREPGGELRGYSLIFQDQTCRKQMEEALRDSEERYRRTVESVTEYAIFTLDSKGIISDWNNGAERILGYRAEDIVRQPYTILFTPENVARGEDQKELHQAAGEGRAEDERWHVKQNGSRFWASGMLMRMQGGEQHTFIKVMRDMTQAKQAEEARLQHLEQIVVLQERNRMAQELHDTLAQGLTGITMQLKAARGLLISEPVQAQYHFDRAITLAHDSLVEVRRSVQGLRPAQLQDKSLAEALEYMVAQITSGTTTVTEFVTQGTARLLQPAVEDDLLRIAQEALTNALRHGHPAHIQVTMTFTSDSVQLKIHDNGQGFDVSACRVSGHYGLIGMRERAQRLNAELVIHSQPERGTEVLVVVPIVAANQEE